MDIPAEHRAFVEGMDARGSFINLYRAMAHSPIALRHFYELLACLWAGALSGRLREIAILSVVSASDAPYPLGWHLLDAEEAGLTATEIRGVVTGDFETVLPASEAAVAAFARVLTIDADVSDEAFLAVAGFMDDRQIVELTMIAGLYRLVSCVANALCVEPDEEPARRIEQFRGQAG
jgi:alkylhydroperoxidase family enzyme